VKKDDAAPPVKKDDAAPPQSKPTTTIPSGMEGVPDIKILKIHKTGAGPKCGTGKSASVRYKAMLADGKVVDPGNQPFTFQVGARAAIVGWDKVVADMRVGDSWTVHIPYQLCYGERGRAGIPAKADMKFDMELLSFK